MKSGIKNNFELFKKKKEILKPFTRMVLAVARTSDQLLVLVCVFCGGEGKLKYGSVFISHKY